MQTLARPPDVAEQTFTKLSRTICGHTCFTGLTGAGTAVAGTAVAGTAVAGTAVAGTAVAGTAVAGTAVAGTAVAGTAVAGTAVAGTAVAGTAVAVGEDCPVLKLALIPTARSEPNTKTPAPTTKAFVELTPTAVSHVDRLVNLCCPDWGAPRVVGWEQTPQNFAASRNTAPHRVQFID
jgi:hypothetical protein